MLKEAGSFFIIAILFLGLCVGYIESQGGSPFALPSMPSVLPAGGDSVVGGPSLSADSINRVLVSNGSPASGTGQSLHDLSLQYGVDDAYALAVFRKESSYGRYGAAYYNHALGNIICAGYYSCNGRFRSYPSWADGYADFYRLIKNEYVAHGLTTVQAITPVYAPSSENNTALYASQVRASLAAFRQGG